MIFVAESEMANQVRAMHAELALFTNEDSVFFQIVEEIHLELVDARFIMCWCAV